MKKAFLLAACLLLVIAVGGVALAATLLNILLAFAMLAIVFLLGVYVFYLHKKFESNGINEQP